MIVNQDKMEDNLNNSRPLDVHVWSDYPEINYLVDALWETYFEPIEVIFLETGK